jgi:hypothetical protein
MNQFPVDMEPDIESELIDLDAISMAALRDLDGVIVERAMRHVMHRTSHPQVTVGGGSDGERID